MGHASSSAAPSHEPDGSPRSPPAGDGAFFRSLLRPTRTLVLVLLALLAWLGWYEFWFLTDDSYITFRYAHNHLHGWGYTWNPPPFRPVEGYSSFLWLVLLEAVWRFTGFEPPDVANTLSLGFSLLTLAIGVAMVGRMRLRDELEAHRFTLVMVVLLATLSNRTFLAWMSGGLETALYTFLITAWCWTTIESQRLDHSGIRAGAAAVAGLAALTRPDGLLFVGATLLLQAHRLATRQSSLGRCLVESLGLATVPVHLLWRRAFYGEWLPNTYFAKYVAAWPESGLRYVASFTLEYAWWLPSLLTIGALAMVVARRGPRESGVQLLRHPAHVIVVAALVAHFGYYTFVIGGDHFEYRVYAHLVLLLWVALLAVVSWVERRPVAVLCLVGTCWVASLPVPWMHHIASQQFDSRRTTQLLRVRLAPLGPRIAAPYLQAFDDLQEWLIGHHVCVRHREHQVFHDFERQALLQRFVDVGRAEGDRPVMVAMAVGVVGWVLPNVAIIDELGLNDRVVARSPPAPGRRRMAHDRSPPNGYLECFRPNVTLVPGRVIVEQREVPLTDDEIRACEERFDPGAPQRSTRPRDR